MYDVLVNRLCTLTRLEAVELPGATRAQLSKSWTLTRRRRTARRSSLSSESEE
jgi:hypothetical protein